MRRSQNGYAATSLFTRKFKIAGRVTVRLRRGYPGWMLVDLANWINDNVERVTSNTWGYADRNIRGSSTEISNHASGTALDYNSDEHPLDATGTWSTHQYDMINQKLLEYEGCIDWGANYKHRKDEMHFEINKPLKDVIRVGRKLKKKRK